MLNCCFNCMSRNKCYKDTCGFPLCRVGIDCSREIIVIGGSKTHKGCIICSAFRPSRKARRTINDRYGNPKKNY